MSEVIVSSIKKNNHFEFCCPVCRKSYRSLALLWAGSSIAHQIVLIPGVLIGERSSDLMH